MTKTDREIELEKKLSIAVKALRYYANSNCWDDCFYNGRIKEIILIIRMDVFTTRTIKLCIVFLLKLFRMTVGNFIKNPNRTGNTSSRTNAFAGFGIIAIKRTGNVQGA